MDRLRLLALTTALVGGSCSPPPPMCTGSQCVVMKDPPQVFLTTQESSTIGTALQVKVNVSGCAKVVGVEVLHNTTFLLSVPNPAKLPVDISLPPSVFSKLYNPLGIALNLNLRARAVCDDGRENKSTAVGVSFFPVDKVVAPTAPNSTALPDAFIAEGGAGGIPTSFLGCVGTATGTALARFDEAGMVIGANTSLPFPCSYDSVISAKDQASGIRWLIEPGVGVLAFDAKPSSPLNVTAYVKGVIPNMGIGPGGDAIIWDSKALGMGANLFRVNKTGAGALVWGAKVDGIMCGTPVVSQNEVRLIMWEGMIGQFNGTMAVWRFTYETVGGVAGGTFISRRALATIDYGEFNAPIIPSASFNSSGTLVYFPFQNAGGMRVTSQVAACASDSATGCLTGGTSSWTSPLLDEVVAAAVPFANGSLVAAISGKKTYFLSATTGAIVNVFNLPIVPTGSLLTMGAQPGNGTDFYLLNGNSNYPTEIIAVDSPSAGELWRMSIEGGQTPLTAVNIAVDDGNNAWLRVGPNLVKPSTLGQYRMQKGMNNLPPDAGG